MWKRLPAEVTPPLYLYERIIAHWVVIYPIDKKIHLLHLLASLFHIYYYSFFVAVAWPVVQQQRSSKWLGWLGQSIIAACRQGVYWACGVSGFKRPCRHVLRMTLSMRLLQWCILCITLKHQVKCSSANTLLGDGRPKNQPIWSLACLYKAI